MENSELEQHAAPQIDDLVTANEAVTSEDADNVKGGGAKRSGGAGGSEGSEGSGQGGMGGMGSN